MSKIINAYLSIALAGLGVIANNSEAQKIEYVLDVSPVWSGHPVGFAMLTYPAYQYIAFYDDQRRMTLASRKPDEMEWDIVYLPESVGWDSHNYITMTVDDYGYLHLSGNMHCDPLVYFRTSKPYDIETFQRINSMVGDREKRCTYPRFFRGAKNELIFTYRDGSSGNGDQIYNIYDHKTQTWNRLLDQPLTSGEGKSNAYLHGPKRGPDGYFHLCWVWRNTPDCSTNHHLSYARSKDLVHWEKSNGIPLKLPITIGTAEIVDPVPVNGGIINGNTILGFDSQKRPVISYHKFDKNGNTQIYNARRENGGWKIYQTSNWDYRWEFKGGGAISFEIRIGAIRVESDGKLSQWYRHPEYGSGTWLLSVENFEITGKKKRQKKSELPGELNQLELDFPGIQKRRADDMGKSGEKGVKYIITWETLGANRDRPREGEIPPPSMLKLYKLKN
ncbi:hypothetical protein GF312_04490 [Candidatus Poribacteria bacterium]|nr:hypothetical protein [Candidatus Poribacteria bacterium]